MFPAGTYECGFSSGSVRHTAKAELKVALLPDQISLNINPLTIDCTENDRSDLKVTATIPNSTENFTVRWKYRDRIPTEDNIKKLSKTNLSLFLLFLFSSFCFLHHKLLL